MMTARKGTKLVSPPTNILPSMFDPGYDLEQEIERINVGEMTPEVQFTGKSREEFTTMTQPGASHSTSSPSAGGTLAHSPTNDTRFADLVTQVEGLAAIAGQGEDVQVKYLLLITQSAFDGAIDNTINKHGDNVDDATVLAEKYWKVRNKNVIFNAKAPNQRKTISTMRQCITLGGWSKGGPGEPIGMVNRAMTMYRDLRKDPATAKRLVDAANYLITLARRMKKEDAVLDDEDLRELAFKPDHDVATVEEVLDAARKTLTKLYTGKHKSGVCASPNIDTAIKKLNAELKAIADSKRTAVNQVAGAAITQAANAQSNSGAPV